MDLVTLIISLSGEILVIFIGSAVFSLLWKEHNRRHERHLLFFGLAALVMASAYVLRFLGQLFFVFGSSQAASFYLAFKYASLAHLFFVGCGLIAAYARKRSDLWYAAAVAAALILGAAFWSPTCNPAMVRSVFYCVSDAFQKPLLLVVWSFVMAVIFLVAVLGRVRSRRRAEGHKPENLLMWASAAGLAYFVVYSVAITAVSGYYFLVVFVFLLAYLVLLLLGAGALGHPEATVAARPINLIRRSLALKVALATVAEFWTLVMVMTIVTMLLFVRILTDNREAGLKRDAAVFSSQMSLSLSSILAETVLAAAEPMPLASLANGRNETIPELVGALSVGNKRAIVRVLDAQGVVIYSSGLPSEIGNLWPSAGVIGEALAGVRSATLGQDPYFHGQVVMQAAAPLIFDDGHHGILTSSRELDLGHDASEFTASQPSGYGLILTDGYAAFVAGAGLSAATVAGYQDIAGPEPTAVRLADGSLIGLERIYGTDGRPAGLFYVLLSNADLEADITRVVSVILIMKLLALLTLSLVLLLGVMTLLKPVRRLRQAAKSLEKDDHAVGVKYDSPDELGDLIEAFNRMSATVVERNASLRAAMREQTDALNHTATELMAPLNVLRWTIDMMRFGDTGSLNKDQLDLVEQMNQINRRLVCLVQNLMDTLKIDQDTMVLKLSSLAAEDIIDEVAGAVSVKAREKDIDFHWHRPEQPLPKVWGDGERLIQVALNLVTNAVKFTGRNGRVTITAETADEASPGGLKGKYVRVAIEDTGRGIPSAEQGRVFSRFFRASNVVGTDIEGAGLGLFLAKRLVEMHGGQIWFTSAEGQGSAFYFTIPTEKRG